jgi:hypothetical protein
LSADGAAAAAAPELRATERWFIRRGLPMFVEDYSAGRDVWTRAVPVLAVLFVLLLLDAADLVEDVLGWVLVGAVLAALGGIYVLANRRAGRAPLARPEHVTRWWLIAFVLLPPLLQVAGTRQVPWEDLVGNVVIAVLLLVLVYVVTRYALVALSVWVVRWTFRQLSDLTRLITRVLPLMLLFITFLFINTEVWQVAGTMTAGVLWGSLAVFGVLGTMFIVGRSREEFHRIETSTDRDVVATALVGTPLEGHRDVLEGLEVPVPLRGRQRGNLILVMVTAQAVQVALVGVVVWAFFIIFGAVAISIPVQEAWLGDLSVIEPLVSLGDDHAVTRQLVRVATFLGGFAGFYATVYAASDQVYRAHFSERIITDLERALAVRRAYLADRRRHGLGDPEPDDPAASL